MDNINIYVNFSVWLVSYAMCFICFPTLASLGTRNESPKLHLTKVLIGKLNGQCLCMFGIPGCCMLTAHETEREIVSPGDPNAIFLM